MKSYDVIIVGAGAAGLFCAMQAGKRGRSVLLIDKASAAGEKIRISGGGRCNFTNIYTSPENYLSQNPHFCKSALERYSPQDFVELVEKHGIAFHEKTLGQLFCDGSSKHIIQMLLDECKAAKVEIRLNSSIDNITQAADSQFTLTPNFGEDLRCISLVIATGGPSIPKMGASDWGYHIAAQFGLNVIEPRAALVPFTLEQPLLEHTKKMAGLSFDATITAQSGMSFREGMLFTHRGLSGPSMLQISSYWKPDEPIALNMLPDSDIATALKQSRETNPKQALHTALQQHLPKRLVEFICNEYGFGGKLAEISNKTFTDIANQVHRWKIAPNGTEGYRTAEVTLGGVDTNDISSQTFESKQVSGLYFIGEVVDVTGHLGGFNFQWAWASGYACGQAV